MNIEGNKVKRHERKALLEFIHKHKYLPALSKVKSKEYANTVARNKGLSALQEICFLVHSHITMINYTDFKSFRP